MLLPEHDRWIQLARQLRRVVPRPGLTRGEAAIGRGEAIPTGYRWPFVGGTAYYQQYRRRLPKRARVHLNPIF